ncbi:hypothetical protein [uncultured Tateyamaria sp.]|uniref:hypothetical protein n=1 Tax=uncultured Tateyamaria sp. TaxID=455651 RepID=UPI0026189139|nr:hypothetical protein [uncultured Tateyamaria sp.]
MTGKVQNPTLFLEKRSYRRRRMMDALRLLPIAGILLWILPVFWPNGQDGPAAPAPVAMSSAVTYVFIVWAVLILTGLALWWAVGRRTDDGEAPEQET